MRQLYYKRTGIQELTAGWKIVASSNHVSDMEALHFQQIASRLAGVPASLAQCLMADEETVYYIQINRMYRSEGEDSRGNEFVHGYLFDKQEYADVCNKPESFLALTESTFFDGNGRYAEHLPECRELDHGAMDLDMLREKYGLNAKRYTDLLKCAVWAAEKYGQPLCIVTGSLDDTSAREILYCIYKGLPYHIRRALTFCTFYEDSCAVYFSEDIRSENYFQLATGEHPAFPESVEASPFFEDYEALIQEGDMDSRYKNMDAYLSGLCNDNGDGSGLAGVNVSWAHEKDMTDSFLEDLCSLDIADFSWNLADHICAQAMEKRKAAGGSLSPSVFRFLLKRFRESDNTRFCGIFAEYYGHLLAEQEDTRQMEARLYEYKRIKPADYPMICSVMQQDNPQLYREYMLKIYLPKEADDAESLIRECLRMEEPAATLIELFSRYKEFYESELSQCAWNIERNKILERYLQNLKSLENAESCSLQPYAAQLKLLFWENFDIQDIELSDLSIFKRHITEQTAEHSPTAEFIGAVSRCYEQLLQGEDARDYYSLMFDNQCSMGADLLEGIVQKFRQVVHEQRYRGLGVSLDFSLAVYYSPAKHSFELDKWLLTEPGRQFTYIRWEDAYVTAPESAKEILARDVFEYQRDKKTWNRLRRAGKSRHIDREKRIIRELNDLLNGDMRRKGRHDWNTLYCQTVFWMAILFHLIFVSSIAQKAGDGINQILTSGLVIVAVASFAAVGILFHKEIWNSALKEYRIQKCIQIALLLLMYLLLGLCMNIFIWHSFAVVLVLTAGNMIIALTAAMSSESNAVGDNYEEV